MISFIVGVFVGTFIGIFMMALMNISRFNDGDDNLIEENDEDLVDLNNEQ